MGVRDTNQDSTTALTVAVAERLRGRLAEKRIRQNEVMLATGWAKTTAWRKMGGKSPLDSDELSILWEAFGISPVYLFTGERDNRPFPGGASDQVSEMSRVQSSEEAPRKLVLVASQ